MPRETRHKGKRDDLAREAQADAEGIERFLHGDERAFDGLVLRYESRVRAFLGRLLGHADDADDVAQETFIRVYENLGGFKGSSSLKTWIFKIAFNLAVDLQRKEKRKPATFSLDASVMESIPERKAEDPRAAVAMKEKAAAVSLALVQLPFLQRAALMMKVSEGLKYKEIAGILDTSKASVKSSIHLARKRLIEMLGET